MNRVNAKKVMSPTYLSKSSPVSIRLWLVIVLSSAPMLYTEFEVNTAGDGLPSLDDICHGDSRYKRAVSIRFHCLL